MWPDEMRTIAKEIWDNTEQCTSYNEWCHTNDHCKDFFSLAKPCEGECTVGKKISIGSLLQQAFLGEQKLQKGEAIGNYASERIANGSSSSRALLERRSLGALQGENKPLKELVNTKR